MSLNSIVLVKQVPDTKNITGQAMKADGTVNRQALPAIFNPDDLCALEMALNVRDRYGGTVTVLSMGPPRAVEILRDSLCRGVDQVILLSDARFAAADTLATSYTLAKAVVKLGMPDILFCGRQAIDGDTAQVGPQLAEKLHVPQATYVQEVCIEDRHLFVKKDVENGYEILRLPMPALLTITAGIQPRPPAAKRLLRYKRSHTVLDLRSRLRKELTNLPPEELEPHVLREARSLEERGLLIPVWTADDVDADRDRIGLPGSPTRVKKVEGVSLVGGETKKIPATEEGISSLIGELKAGHILG
ncbi:MAG: electron transfer flavoprotein subunit beta/FixA family protein [bacterium]